MIGHGAYSRAKPQTTAGQLLLKTAVMTKEIPNDAYVWRYRDKSNDTEVLANTTGHDANTASASNHSPDTVVMFFLATAYRNTKQCFTL